MDGSDAAPHDDVGDAAPDANVAPESGPVAPVSVRLAAGSKVIGVTTDDYVVFWATNDAGSSLAAAPAAGGTVQVLSTTTTTAVVAGSTVVWLEGATADGGACGGAAIESWTSAHGAVHVAPYAEDPGSFGVTESAPLDPETETAYRIAVNADGSKVAYLTDCEADALAVASTDGSSAPLTVPLTPALPPTFYLNGDTLTLRPAGAPLGPLQVFAGNPLTVTIPNLAKLISDPTGAWAWEPAATGMQLVKTSDGSVVYTDPMAPLDFAVFDERAEHFFYASAEGVRQVEPGAAAPVEIISGTGVGNVVATAPDGSTVLCEAADDGGITRAAVTTGPMPRTYSLPPVREMGFLADGTITWFDSGTLSVEPVLGGPVVTVATSVDHIKLVGGTQAAIFRSPGPTFAASIVDARGTLPTVAVDPTPDTNGVFAPPAGGVVAYASGGAIYAIRTR